MITNTVRKNVVRALRQALRIREVQAREILDARQNEGQLYMLRGLDTRTVKALVTDAEAYSPRVGLYVDMGQGYERTGVQLVLTSEDVARWKTLPIEEAYAIAADIHENRGPELTAADERVDAELAANAANDDEIVDLDDVFGPVPEKRDWSWTDGKVVSAEVAPSGDHVVVMVELENTNQAMAMFPLFSDAAGLLSYVSGRIDVPARLCVTRLNAFDQDVPAGYDRAMPVLDMVIPQYDVPALQRTLARAA